MARGSAWCRRSKARFCSQCAAHGYGWLRASWCSAANSGASSPLSVAATAGVWMGMRAARKAPASMICAASVGGRRLSSPGEARDGAEQRRAAHGVHGAEMRA
jgi:hypothetical protein